MQQFIRERVWKSRATLNTPDKHNVSSFNSNQYVVNGAFFGSGKHGAEYSEIAGFSSIPAQWMAFHCPRHDARFSVYDSYVIQLGHVV